MEKNSEKKFKKAIELNPSYVTAHHWYAEYLYLMGRMNEALITADELKEMIQKGVNRKIMRLYHHLMGMIELKRDNFSQAIEYFNKAISLLPSQYSPYFDNHALFIEPLALAYYKAGDVEKAREEYERIISITTGRFYYGDIYAKSFYMLGRIYQEKGWVGKAIEHYDKFLYLWKGADSDTPEVEDAKKR